MATSWYEESSLPKFENPPVAETAMGVEFSPVEGLGFIGLTRLQERWAQRFPILTEMGGMPPTYDSAPPFEFVQGTPPVRVWAEGIEDGLLVQTQADRLILNWRHNFTPAPYPGYHMLRAEYEALWNQFLEFLGEFNLRAPAPIAAEYTYVNNVQLNQGETYADVISVIAHPERELPGDDMGTRFQFTRGVAPSEENPYPAQIWVAGEPFQGDPSVLLLNVTTKVLFAAGGEPLHAIDIAHALSSHTFANITSESKHADWSREA
ncbi:TIGR04255 family protein [Glaciihabitans arcticus]|uniref:TIGR04255 family protein n=1 Tax=Glaciihabitans arcticus TaxID=2668039 RepID=UPI0013872F9C|nr:TIGR04255 family protein [Glaciihabitans arcticus]